MKKSLVATLLVALLASSMVFAGFSGNVTASFGWNIDEKKVGFDNVNAPEIELTLNETAGEKKGEGAVYAEIKANLVVKLSKVTGVKATTTKDSLEVIAEIKDLSAKVIGDNWYVGIIGAMDTADFAKSYSQDDDKNANWNWKLGAVKPAGVEVGLLGYTAGIGFNKEFATNSNTKNGAFFSVKTPEYTFIEGLTAQAGATVAVQDKEFKNGQYGFGGKVAFAKDALAVNVAADMGYIADAAKDGKFEAEIAANAKYDFISLNTYFATKTSVNSDADNPVPQVVSAKNLLNAKLAADFASFKLPLTASVEMIDAANEGRILEAKAGYTIIEGLKVGLGYKTTLVEKPSWGIKGDVEYTLKDVATFKTAVEYKSAKTLSITASAESKTLVNGATLKLAYSDNLINLYEGAPANTAGKVVASCKIAF